MVAKDRMARRRAWLYFITGLRAQDPTTWVPLVRDAGGINAVYRLIRIRRTADVLVFLRRALVWVAAGRN